MISYHSAFAFRSPARALAAGLPRQDHVYKVLFVLLMMIALIITLGEIM